MGLQIVVVFSPNACDMGSDWMTGQITSFAKALLGLSSTLFKNTLIAYNLWANYESVYMWSFK